MIADRIHEIAYSPTLRINAKAQAMRAEGIDVIDLSVGEPDFSTPDHIKEAGKQAIDKNFTKYTANSGMPALKEAIIRRIYNDHGVKYEKDEIIISSGGKNSLYNLAMAIFNPGDEAIIPAPYWVSYPEIVNLAKGTPVIVPTREENGFKLTPKDLSRAINSRTKALIINNPCNPTGTVYSREELEELAEIAVDEGLLIISDEIYDKLVYDGFRFFSMAALGDKIKRQTVVINGASKAYAMTGWRIGYAAGPKEIIAAMDKVQSHSTSNACTISQKACIEAFGGPQNEINKMVSEFQRRRNYMHYRLTQIPKVSCYKSQGAFYLFPNFSAYYDYAYEGTQIRNSNGLAYYLLKEAKVAVVPGEAFGDDKFIRFSYANSMENIEKAMDRITEAMARLVPVKKAERKPLNNTVTKRKTFVEVEPNISLEMRNALMAESEAFMTFEGYYEWNVNIAGIVIQLRTNSPHLYDFWVENFYPAQLETDLEPHAIIYAVNWITGREPRAFYNQESRTAFYFKSAFYPQLRSLALGMVADITERLYNLHSVRAQSVDIGGKGLLLMGPPGTGKMEQFAELLKQPQVKLHSNDFVVVRYIGSEAIADTVERKFAFNTDFVEKFPQMVPLFDLSKCENVVTSKDECTNEKCKREDNCRLDRGAPYCFSASKISIAMLDPYWLGGPERHVKRTKVNWVLLFRKDPISPAIVKLNPEEALKILEEGRAQSSYGGMQSVPFFNPHLLVRSMDRMELQKRYFQQLLKIAPCYMINSALETPDQIKARIAAIIAGNEAAALQ
ncbi:MAG: pyridoxal phosphate-dependent aminotransferase [candidate division KSB1 bacterium]|nr:pyridoxal phosphate-dependent aminotransferase [candidate division KSB1 bacterium]MDZ7336385.1 pyridoxal phosphate-dependent aminotransferase [candidate division KSB1 bacterium]